MYFFLSYFILIISVHSKVSQTQTNTILPKNKASDFLHRNNNTRTKRDNNSIFEETFNKDNLERECLEQSCVGINPRVP